MPRRAPVLVLSCLSFLLATSPRARAQEGLIVGPGLPMGGPVRADEAGIARGRALLEELRDELRVDDPSAFVLERAVAVPNPNGQELVYINFKQVHEGLDVRHQAAGGAREHLAMVQFQFNGTLGRLVLRRSDAVPGLAVPAAIALGEGEAAHRALGAVAARGGAAERVATRSYVSVRGDRRFLAREVEVATSRPYHEWKALFDAHTGELVEVRDDARSLEVSGTIRGGTSDHPGGTFAVHPLNELRVSTVPIGTETWTNATGFFLLPTPGPVLIGGQLYGRWVDVNDASGNGALIFLESATPGVPVSIVMNPTSGAEFETAEVAAYVWAQGTRDFIKFNLPSFNGLESLPVRVNDDAEQCQAYGGAGGLRFFRSSGTCNNTAFRDVIAHEYGHAFHAWFHGGLNPAGFSEGIGDHLAMYVTGQRVVGRNFYANGNPVRDYRPGRSGELVQWPCTGCEQHLAGQVWAGFTMDLRDNLIASMGSAAGVARARAITIAPYASNPADEIAMLLAVIAADDDDGNLVNGTPRCREIVAAAQRHGLPVPHLLGTACGLEPPPPNPEYRAPVVEPGINGSLTDWAPALDGTGLDLWWTSQRAGGSGGTDLWTASRASVSAPWSAPAPEAALNSASNDAYPAVTGNGRLMFFASQRPGGQGGWDLYASLRAGPGAPWGIVSALFMLNSPSNDTEPTISPDGQELFFVSDRPGSQGTAIWTNLLLDPVGTWGTPTRVAELDSAGNDRSPVLSADGTRLLLSRPTGQGEVDWWLFRRGGRGLPWSLWRHLGEISNDNASEFGGDETADGFSFYFSRSSLVSTSILRADRIHPRIVAGRTARAGQPAAIALRRDPGDVAFLALGLQTIAPTAVPGISGDLAIVPLAVVASGVHDANGLLGWTAAAPAVPGLLVWFQGLSQAPAGGLFLSNRHQLLVLP
jgi:hypothetical protein